MKVSLNLPHIIQSNPFKMDKVYNFLFFILDEDLIKWGWPEDVWFHVDKHSSAHVYLRLQYVSITKFI